MTDNNELIVNFYLARQEIDTAITNAINQYHIPYVMIDTILRDYAHQIISATTNEVNNAYTEISKQNAPQTTEEREQDETILTEEKLTQLH